MLGFLLTVTIVGGPGLSDKEGQLKGMQKHSNAVMKAWAFGLGHTELHGQEQPSATVTLASECELYRFVEGRFFKLPRQRCCLQTITKRQGVSKVS